MVLKKKVVAGTIAASLAFTALAGLPLSNKGLAEKLGISVAFAAGNNNFEAYEALANAINDQLTVNKAVYAQSVAKAVYPHGVNEESAASVTYTVYSGTSEQQSVGTDVYDIAKPVTGKLNLGEEGSDNYEAVDTLIAAYLKFIFGQDADAFNDTSLEVASKVNDATGLEIADFNDFLFGTRSVHGSVYSVQGTVYSVQDSVYGQLSGMTTTQLNGLTDQDYTSDYAIVKVLLAKAFEQALANGSDVSKYLVSNEVNKADFEALIENFRNAVDPVVFDKAISELFKAYIQANGITGTPDYVGGIGGGSAVVTDPSVAQLVQDLAALKSKIAAATGEEKDKLIAQAVAKANEVVAKILTLDLSSQVQNVNGKATLTLSAADVNKLIAAVADSKKALADAVGTADGLNIGDITINLGAITQSGASVTLPQELWTLANDVKADGVAIKVGALSATLPVGTFTEAVTLGVTIESGDAASSVTSGVYGKSVASDVYGFDLQVGGKAVEQFNKPIKLRLPLKNLTSVDKELLTTGRVEADGKVSTQGGTLDGDFIVEPRYSFSKYFVFENKVSFNDIAKVQSWAGRQIEVVAAKGAIEGKSAGIFAPQDKITRAEFAKILITALNLDNTLATSSKFSDVPASHWAAPYIAVAAEQGIINGKTASTFAPNATITRAEMATMIARALKATQGLKDIDNAEAALSVFKDANKIGSAFRSSVAWAAASDIIIGANGKFLPNNNATRAEAAVIIYRAVNFKPQA